MSRRVLAASCVRGSTHRIGTLVLCANSSLFPLVADHDDDDDDFDDDGDDNDDDDDDDSDLVFLHLLWVCACGDVGGGSSVPWPGSLPVRVWNLLHFGANGATPKRGTRVAMR